MPIALYPDSLGYIFSGSAVVDHQNTSGLGGLDQPALVAIFTYHDPEGEKKGSNTFQNQGIAYSTDKGRTWTKYAGNPVLRSPGIRDFRDPKVFWHTETGKWIMILAVQDRVHLYSSPNLIDWTFESEFGKGMGAHGGVWECPDLFPLKVDSSEVTKWVMLVSLNPGGPNSGSATQYFVGEFDGHRFVGETDGNEWVDWGRDNYAGVTWSDIPESDGRRIFLGWMSNWQYAAVVPTYVWRSAMTIPRELSLIRDGMGYRLLSKPVKELEFLRIGNPVALYSQQHSGEIPATPDSIPLTRCEISLGFRLQHDGVDSVGLVLLNGRQEKFIICYSQKTKKIIVDRSSAGSSGFSNAFSGQAKAPYKAGEQLHFRLFVDASSVELFVDNGKIVMTSLVFPTEEFTSLVLFSAGGTVVLERAAFYELKNIWQSSM
jgi:fructan beta-fructosidase